jgi:UDP-3-O-[3-hydroxymyristoyl] glucosamine N-acyltransferase
MPNKIMLSALAELFSAELIGSDIEIDGVASLSNAAQGRIAFLANPKLIAELTTTQASAVILKDATEAPRSLSYLVCKDPNLIFARIAQYFNPLPTSKNSIHASAVVANTATLGQGVEIGPHVVIEDNAIIGDFAQIKAGTFIGAGSTIGEKTILMPRVTIYQNCDIGRRCHIHSGVVIGSDGFGNAWAGDHWERIPQIGKVILGDDVEVGANTTIDRGALDDTVIDAGVRLDNLIQIAHNVKIGANTAIAACTGIAGSAKIGRNCLIGGGVLIAGHIEITDQVTILAGSGVPSSLGSSGIYASGVPVVPHQTWLRNMVHFRKLDELAKRIKMLEKSKLNQQFVQGEKNDAN